MTTMSPGGRHAHAHSTAVIAGHPIHPMLITLPIGFWMGTLLADIGFWWIGADGWATAALWLLGSAIITAAVAATTGLIDFLGDQRIRALSDAWQHAIGNALAVLVSLFSFYWRYRYGPTAVLPTGLILSAVTIAVILFTGWKGGELVFHHHVAVSEDESAR